MSKPREQSVKELTFRCTTYLTYEQAATGCQRGIIISRYWQNSSWQEPKPKWDSSVQFCTISISFFSFLILPVTHSCPPSLLQVCASPLAFHRASDFCVVELLFLFVPLTIPYTIAACLPPDSSVCQRWLQQNRLWEQPVSLPWSPAPQPEGQPSIQRSPYPCTHTEAQTHKYPTKLILTQKPYNAHTLSQ